MKYLANLALLLVARNIQSLLDFVTALDKRLDGFIASRDAETAAINRQIDALTDKRAGVEATKQIAARLKTGVTGLIG